MYIPLMSLVTYILLYTLIAGLRGAFRPELLGSISGTALVVVVGEIMFLKLMMYLLSIQSESQLFDLVAYSGYKFVGVIVTLAVAEMWNRGGGTGGWVGWTVFAYTFAANAFFLVGSYLLRLSLPWFFLRFSRESMFFVCAYGALSYGHCDMSCCQTRRPTAAALALTPPTGRRRAGERSSCSATRISCNLC